MILLQYDPQVDALYVRLRDAFPERGEVHRTRELDDRRRVDYDERGDPVGIEILEASLGVPLNDVPRADEIREALRSLSELTRVA